MKVNLIKKDGIIYGYQTYPLNKNEIVEISEEQLKLIQQYSGKLDTHFNVLDIKTNNEKQDRINELKGFLREYDYIGTKIATGRATIEEYKTEIELMNRWAEEINELEEELVL